MSAVLSLRPSYYEALKRLTLELVGVNLGSDHTFLVETRLATLARKEGFEDLSGLIEELFSHGQARLAIKVVSALLERDTHFNPDPEIIRQIIGFIIPNLERSFPQTRLRILSFGCSSGQEPFSIAMHIQKIKDRNPQFDFEIIGVDYPSPALDRARQGIYTHFEVQRGLPIRDLVKYFDRRGEDWIVKPDLAKLVSFREHHLLSSLEELGRFHLVVFRNGLARYATSAQVRVMRSLSSVVLDNGYLLLGAQDNPPRLTYGLKVVNGATGLLHKEPKPPVAVDPVEAFQNQRVSMIESYAPSQNT